MSNEGTVNSQVTDSVTQVDTLMLGNSGSEAMSLLDLVSAETIGMSMHNAVSSQHNSQMSASAAVTASCAKMLSVSPPPIPTPIPEKSDIPPPFMPLDGGKKTDKTAEQLVKEATAMAEKAIKIIEASDNQTNEDVSVLQGLMDKIKALTGNGSNENDASSKQTKDTEDEGDSGSAS